MTETFKNNETFTAYLFSFNDLTEKEDGLAIRNEHKICFKQIFFN